MAQLCPHGRAVPPSCRQLSQIAAATRPLARLDAGAPAIGVSLGKQTTSWPAWNRSSANTLQKSPGLSNKSLLSCLAPGIWRCHTAPGPVPCRREGRWTSLRFSRWLISSRCHHRSGSRVGRDADMQRKRLLWAQVLGFLSLLLYNTGTGAQGLVHAPGLVLADLRGHFLLHNLHHSKLVCY